MVNLAGIFRRGEKCSRCGRSWPSKEAYYDVKGQVYCTMECVRAARMDRDDEFKVEKGERPA